MGGKIFKEAMDLSKIRKGDFVEIWGRKYEVIEIIWEGVMDHKTKEFVTHLEFVLHEV